MQLSKDFLSETTRPRAFTVTFDLFLRWATQGPLGPLVYQRIIMKFCILVVDTEYMNNNKEKYLKII